jgi:diamine N-acetyltransferase
MVTTTRADIRSAQPKDAEALSKFAQSSFADTFAYRNYPPADLAAFFDRYMAPEIFADYITSDDYRVHIAWNASDEIIGYMRTGPVTLPLPEGYVAVQGLELHQLYIATSAKGTGLAQDFMAMLFDQAQAEAAKALYLSVYSENIRAQRFYTKYGFREIGSNPFWVGRVCDDDRIWMCAV